MDFDHIGNLNETNGCFSNAGGAASWIALDLEFWIDLYRSGIPLLDPYDLSKKK